MATIKILHYSSKKYNDGTSPILLRLTIDRKIKYFTLPDNFRCLPSQWDLKNGQFNNKYPNFQKSNKRLLDTQLKAMDIISILNQKNNDEGFTHDEFEMVFKKKTSKFKLIEYFTQIVENLESRNKIGNATIYKDAKSQFSAFFDNDIEMKNITLKDLNKYVEQSKKNNHKDTTVSVRMRTLRAVFNKARKEEGLENYPFTNFDWSQFNLQTEKRAISKNELLKIYNFPLDPGKPLFEAKMYWLFIYYCYGLNFVDLAKLEPKNIVSDDEGQKLLVYYRSKTNRKITVPISEKALEIINYYKNQNFGNKYIFPILDPEIHKTGQQIKYRVQTALKKFNDEINQLATIVGIDKHLTSYTARHSFATILKKEMIPTAIISEMMGHKTESITQTYLDSFDNSTKSEAAKKLL
jgi:integrase/recombinase XerD